jgi:hypothetical protein
MSQEGGKCRVEESVARMKSALEEFSHVNKILELQQRIHKLESEELAVRRFLAALILSNDNNVTINDETLMSLPRNISVEVFNDLPGHCTRLKVLV